MPAGTESAEETEAATEEATEEAEKAVEVKAVEMEEAAMAAAAMAAEMAVEVKAAEEMAAVTAVAETAEVAMEVATAVGMEVAVKGEAMAECLRPRQHSNARPASHTPRDSRKCDRCCQAPPRAALQRDRDRTPPTSTPAGHPNRTQ